MANPSWNSTTSTDWETGANWDTGSKPVAADNVFIGKSSLSIDVSVPAGLDYTTVGEGTEFFGALGTEAAPLKLGDVPDVRVNAPNAIGSYFSVINAKTVSRLLVEASIGRPNGVVLQVAGTGQYAKTIVKGGYVRTVGACKIGDLFIDGPSADVDFVATGVLANCYMSAGIARFYATVTGGIYTAGGLLDFVAASALTIPLVVILGGTWRFASNGGTATRIIVGGTGVLDLDAGPGTPRTITTLDQIGGTVIKRGKGKNVAITNDNWIGGARR